MGARREKATLVATRQQSQSCKNLISFFSSFLVPRRPPCHLWNGTFQLPWHYRAQQPHLCTEARESTFKKLYTVLKSVERRPHTHQWEKNQEILVVTNIDIFSSEEVSIQKLPIFQKIERYYSVWGYVKATWHAFIKHHHPPKALLAFTYGSNFKSCSGTPVLWMFQLPSRARIPRRAFGAMSWMAPTSQILRSQQPLWRLHDSEIGQ